MKNKKSIFLLFIILFISIGFALLSSNLNLNGLVGFSKSSWDVHFDDVQVINNDIVADIPVIDAENTSISFGGTFKQPGEVFEFNVDVVNDGTIDAMINTLLKTGITADNSDYLNYEVKYYDGSEIKKYDFLGKKTRNRINVKVEYKYDVSTIPNLSGQEFSLSLEYVSSTDEAVDRNNSFKKSEKSKTLYVNNAKENSLSNLKIFGNNEQTLIIGNQVIKNDAFSTANSDNEFWYNYQHTTALSDGWRKANYDNTSGTSPVYCNLFIKKDYVELEADTYYTAFLEWKNLEGIGSFSITQVNFTEDPFAEYVYNSRSVYFNDEDQKSGFTKFLVKTKSDLTNSLGLRAWVGVRAGYKISVDVRLTLVKGNYYNNNDNSLDNITSPSPTSSKEVMSVENNLTFLIKGKNLLNYNKIGSVAKANGIKVDDEGYIYDSNPLEDTRYWEYANCNFYTFLTPGTYTFSLKMKTTTAQENNYDNMTIYKYNGDSLYNCTLHNKNEVVGTFKITEATEIGFLIKGYESAYRIQLEAGDKASSWESYKEKEFTISLGDIKLNGIGDNRDYIHNINGKWFIHKAIEKQIFDGTEEYKIDDTVDGITQFSVRPNFNPKMDNEYINYVLSDRFRGMEFNLSWLNNNTVNSRHNYYLRFNTNKATTIQEFKTLLSNNNATVYYVLDTPQEIEIKDETLINQLNSILESNLYEGINNINFKSNINTDISFDYKQK